MAITKRGEIWWVSFTTPNGERIRRSSGTADRKAAQEFHDRLKTESWRVHRLGDKPRRKWQEAVVRWATEKQHKADYQKDIAKFRWLHNEIGHKFLDDISRDVVDQLAAKKRDESTASTANRYLALLRAVLRMARDEWEWVERIPRIRLFQESKKRVRWLTREEAGKLIQLLPDHLADMAEFSLATGLRQSNVSYLKWNQVDMVRGVAWIHPDESKSKRAIAVPLNDDAMSVLQRRQGVDPDYVFTYRGAPVERTSTKAWHRALKRAGIENFRWHDLRHTWASWHVQSGTSLNELMELGGWSSFEMVLRYAHFAGEHLKTAASRINGTILTQSPKTEVESRVVCH